MKTVTILLTIFFVQQFYAQVDKTSTITVVVENLKSDEGSVLASLYTEKTFLSDKPEMSSKSEVVDGKATITFENVPAGVYGISIFHDINSNNKMDFDASGMPMENYGISNNKFNPYGPPVWTDARFELSEPEMEFKINLTR